MARSHKVQTRQQLQALFSRGTLEICQALSGKRFLLGTFGKGVNSTLTKTLSEVTIMLSRAEVGGTKASPLAKLFNFLLFSRAVLLRI